MTPSQLYVFVIVASTLMIGVWFWAEDLAIYELQYRIAVSGGLDPQGLRTWTIWSAIIYNAFFILRAVSLGLVVVAFYFLGKERRWYE